MSEMPEIKGSDLEPESQPPQERLVYVMPKGRFPGSPDDEISLRELWDILWRGRLTVVAVTLAFAIASVAYALLATEWFRAEVLLAPAHERSTPSLGGQLGGLAALAGVSVGGGDSAEAVATLKSRELAREFIEEHDLLTVFFADDWDAKEERWIGDDSKKWPDVRDAIKYFREDILKVGEDLQTGLVTLAIEWKDADLAADWANDLVRRVNTRLRERALREAEANVAYLQEELSRTNLVTLQQTIGGLLESELQKLMLARGNDEFAFRVIDKADAPKERVRPKRVLIAVLTTLLGGMLGAILVFLVNALRPSS
jgi:uncharacterized protein involved in exopolysaccharide biosynthesis